MSTGVRGGAWRLVGPASHWMREAVFTSVTRGHFLTSASKFNIAPNGRIFDVSP